MNKSQHLQISNYHTFRQNQFNPQSYQNFQFSSRVHSMKSKKCHPLPMHHITQRKDQAPNQLSSPAIHQKNYFSTQTNKLMNENDEEENQNYKNDDDDDTVTVHFVDLKNNIEKTVQAKVGQHILEIAHQNHIDLEGACEASLACSTCHVYVQDEYYDKLPEPVEEEEDMLDLAFGLSHNSRLGCQVFMTKELDGMTVTLPRSTRNMQIK